MTRVAWPPHARPDGSGHARTRSRQIETASESSGGAYGEIAGRYSDGDFPPDLPYAAPCMSWRNSGLPMRSGKRRSAPPPWRQLPGHIPRRWTGYCACSRPMGSSPPDAASTNILRRLVSCVRITPNRCGRLSACRASRRSGTFGRISTTPFAPDVRPLRNRCRTAFWGYLAQNPEHDRTFNDAMTGLTHAQVSGILNAYDFSGFKKIADIGGGNGNLLRAIRAVKATRR